MNASAPPSSSAGRHVFTRAELERLADAEVVDAARIQLLNGVRYDREGEAADGRHLFTRKDALRMWEIDLFEGRRFELLNGDIYDMAWEGTFHQTLRDEINDALYRHIILNNLPLRVSTNGPLRLADRQEPEPDTYGRPAGVPLDDVDGPAVLLAIELCLTNRERDIDIKPPIYAAHGVRDYWLVDLDAWRTVVRRGPQPDGSWAETKIYEPNETVEALLIPGFRFTLDDYKQWR
jgi:Uma2 family endonuclease